MIINDAVVRRAHAAYTNTSKSSTGAHGIKAALESVIALLSAQNKAELGDIVEEKIRTVLRDEMDEYGRVDADVVLSHVQAYVSLLKGRAELDFGRIRSVKDKKY